MPDTLDLERIGRLAGTVEGTAIGSDQEPSLTGVPEPPPPPAPIDLDAIGRSANFDEALARDQRRQDLWQQKNLLATQTAVPDLVMRFDPLGTFFRGLRGLGNVAAGAVEDIGLGAAYPETGQPPTLENVRSALTTYEPTPLERDLQQVPGVSAALTRGGISAVKTAPTLAAGAVISGVTKLPPAAVYSGLFGAEAYERTGSEYEALKAATIGALYPLVGTWVKPTAATLINKLGASGSPVAQKAIETVVDQALMQAATQVISLPEYAEMVRQGKDDQIADAIAENVGNILLFAVPRVIGYARGHPAEYERDILIETDRLKRELQKVNFRNLRETLQTLEVPEERTAAAMRAGVIPIRPAGPPAIPEPQREVLERDFRRALRRDIPAASPLRRLAAQFAQEEVRTPVGITQPTPTTTEVPSAVHIETERPVRTVQQPGGTTEGAGKVPADVGGAEAGARGGGVAREEVVQVPLPEAKEGDIVELYGYVGQYTKDENGRPIIQLSDGRIVEANEPVKLRLTVTQDGKIIWKGNVYEPAVGGGKPWRNAYNQATGRLKIRRVDGSGGVTYFIGPSSDYIVTRLNALYPPKPLAKPSKVPRLTEKETTADAALPGEIENVDTPVDEFIFNTGLARELAENKAARMEVKNNQAIDLPEFPLERMRRHPAPQPHSGDIKPARMLYNPSGASAGFLNFLRGKHYSYRIPLSELPTGSWGKLPGGAWFDKRAILAFLSNNERRFANRNASGENEYFTSRDIDTIRGVTTKTPAGTVPQPGRPRTTVTGNVSLDQPAGEEGTVGNIVTAEPRYISRMSGIVKRTFDNLLKDHPELFNDLLDKPAEQLSEEFWGRVRAAIAAQKEFQIDPKSNITTPEKQAQAIDLMLNELRVRKETPGGFGEQGMIGRGVTPELARELLPFFDLLKLSDAELKALGKKGTFGPEPPEGLSHAEAAVESVANGERIFGYVELGTEVGAREGLRLAQELGLVLEKGTDRFGKGNVYFYKPENAAEAKRRMALLNVARYTRELMPAWGYLHGAILGYKPEDIAWFLTRHPLKDYARDNIAGARAVMDELQRGVSERGALIPTVKIQGRGNVPIAGFDRVDNPERYMAWLKAKGLNEQEVIKALGDLALQREFFEDSVTRGPQEANLQDARRLVDDPRNGLPDESKAVLRAMLDSPVMQYFTARPIRFRLVDYLRNLDARYDTARQLIEMTRTGDPLSGAHEFFHPLFEMLKQEDLNNLKRWRDEAIASEMKTATGKDLEDLKKLAASEYSVRQFIDAGINRELYRYSSVEEYFAHMLTERWNQERIGVWGQAKDAMAAQDGFVAKVKELIRVIIEAIKRSVPGLRTQADALRKQILSGNYDVLPPDGKLRDPQAMLESPEKIEKFLEPLEETETPEKFHEIASVLNKGLINPEAAGRFAALPEGVREELKDLYGGRIATHQEEAGPSFREVMRNPDLTPEEKSDYSRYALMEWQGFKADEEKIKNRLATANRKLEQLTLDAIEAIPETNEAEVRATNSLGQVLDKIKEEREKTAEGAQVNERIREGIDHLDALNDLLRSPVGMSHALRDISDLVGRRALTEERPGEEVLELISARSGFEGGVFATPAEWVRALARHLDRMRDPDGDNVIAASEDVIEATLWMLRQCGDWKQELLEARMADDGTLRRFNAEYLNDLRARVPRGFDSILRQYATAQVEADALRSASNRLNRKIINLEERRNNLQQGVEFINQHATDPTLKDFEKAMQETTGAISGMERTDDGWIVKLKHPLTGNEVRLNLGFEKGESQETLKMMAQLAEAGLEYGNRPDADPLKAAWWRHFEENLYHPLMALNPNFDILKDPIFDPIKEITKLKYFLLVESNLSKIPGILPAQTTRALGAFASAVKTEYEIARVFRNRMLNDNLIALRSHTNGLKDDVKTLRQWRDEVAGPIIDSMQHFGQIVYREGDRIGGWGHVITAEDMKAVKSQYGYDQRLIKLSGGAEKIPAVREFQTMVKEPAVPGRKERSMDVLRLALSRGPGTTTRYLTDESRALPAQWKLAVERNNVDTFLNQNDNFIKLVLGHVLEDDRDYVMLGKGRFASDYKRIRQDEQELMANNQMPTNIQDLSQFVADLHNMHLGEMEMPATAGDVRRALIEEVSGYMRKMQEDNEKKETSARVGIVSYENEYTQARGGKVAPGSLYRYGITDPIDVIRKGNNALEPYVVRVRDYLKLVENALLEEKRKLLGTLNEVYGNESVGTRMKAAKVVTEGIGEEGPSLLQRHQMTLEELNANIDRVGKLLGNFNDIIRRREEFYGDDLISQLAKPMFDASVGTVLLSPTTWIVNRASGEVTWAMKLAEVMRGGWLRAGPTLLKNHVKTFMRAVQRQFVPKTDRERIMKSLMTDAMEPVAEQFTGLLADIQDWEQMRRSGVIDAYDYKDALGWDRERPLLQNLRGSLDALRDIRAEPNLSLRSEIFGRLGMLPRGWAALWRKVGMRQVDNSINVQAIAISNSIADMLRKRAIRSFDARLESDPKFRQLYEQYGNNFKQFSLHLLGEHHLGIMLTPAELTGRYNPLNVRKAAVMIRRMFTRNNDPVDLVMLKYWWNQRNANGDRNAAFMTPGQRWALQFTLAEDANMATPNTRPTFFMGSRERQMLGVLSQWWLWNTDRMRDLYSKVRGQKTYAARYLPAVFGFLTATAVASLFGTTAGQKVNQALYNTLANTPGFWDAETDEERLKILTSISANYWGMIGSAIKMFTDTPGKLGYRNPVFLYNLATDLAGAAAKMWQSGDYTGPTLDLLARYNPALRAVINRLPGREGLVDLRNASNALRAATPDSLEARRRQPASGSDIRATPMTPLYNAILNAAMAGDWGTADEVFQRAVAQATALGIPNPEQAIVSAIRTRAPESAVFSRRLTDEERDLVYSRLKPAGREAVDKANSAFEELASRYGGGGGGAAGGARAAIAGAGGLRAGLPRSAALGGFIAGPGVVGLGGQGTLSLAPRPVRSSFRSRSLARGRRTRNLLRPVLARPRVGRRLRRLAL